MKTLFLKPIVVTQLVLFASGTLFSPDLEAASVKKSNTCPAIYGLIEPSKNLVNFLYNIEHGITRLAVKSEGSTYTIASENPFVRVESGNFSFESDYRKRIDEKLITVPPNKISVRPSAAGVAELIAARAAEKQAKIDAKSTEMLGREFGMGFKDKSGKPFDVVVNGIPLVIERPQFDALVKGMEPTFQIMREILQVFVTNPNAPLSAYPLKHISKQDLQYVINEMKNSPYFDPATTGKNFKDTKFGAVYGVDAVFGQLDKHLSHIFEINAGTPSGFSNLTLILEVLRRTDPELFKEVVVGMSKNDAFNKLRNVIDGFGEKILEDGVSVELGIGIYEGAHPDISMIAHFSGMPRVERSDMFIDRDGYLRLNKKLEIDADGYYNWGGRKVKHIGSDAYKGYVQIWSIYSRAEEGNALNEVTGPADGKDPRKVGGIGLKVPSLVPVNKKFAEKRNLNIPLGVMYKYVRDEKGEPIDFLVNEKGQPELEAYWDQFSNDPVDPNNKSKSLFSSLEKRRTYLSNFQTRLIDHKGILAIVTKEAKGRMAASGKDPDKTVVSTPAELRGPEALQALETNPRQYVVKVPDESGGVGVYILPTSSDKEIQRVTQLFRDNMNGYVVQSLADFMSTISVSNVNGKPTYVSRANDERVFIFFDADGKASSDPFAILVRVASHLKLSTNTSQGAEYGFAKVMNKAKEAANYHENFPTFPKARLSVITGSQSFHLKNYLISINMVLDGSFGRMATADQTKFLNTFWQAARHLMPVLGPNFSYAIRLIEEKTSDKISIAEFIKEMQKLESELRSKELDPLIQEEVHEYDQTNPFKRAS
jgi:uncharacterized circularly permuted ATP-grasp superfamily protein